MCFYLAEIWKICHAKTDVCFFFCAAKQSLLSPFFLYEPRQVFFVNLCLFLQGPHLLRIDVSLSPQGRGHWRLFRAFLMWTVTRWWTANSLSRASECRDSFGQTASCCVCLSVPHLRVWQVNKPNYASFFKAKNFTRPHSPGCLIFCVRCLSCWTENNSRNAQAHTHSKYWSSLCISHIQTTQRQLWIILMFLYKEKADLLQKIYIDTQSFLHNSVVFLIFVVQYWVDTKQEKPQCWFAISSQVALFRWLIWGQPSVAEGCRRCRGKIMDGSGGSGSNKKVAPVRLQPRLLLVCVWSLLN